MTSSTIMPPGGFRLPTMGAGRAGDVNRETAGAEVTLVPIDEIEIPEERVLGPWTVAELKASVLAEGLLQPIGVKLVKDTIPKKSRAIYGVTRLLAWRELHDEALARLNGAPKGASRKELEADVGRWEQIPAIVYPKHMPDERCRRYEIIENLHRRPNTPEERRVLMEALLRENPERSNREIARLAGVRSHNTVQPVRSDLEARGQIDHVETRTDTKGRSQPAKKPVVSRPAVDVTKAETKAKAAHRRRMQRLFGREDRDQLGAAEAAKQVAPPEAPPLEPTPREAELANATQAETISSGDEATSSTPCARGGVKPAAYISNRPLIEIKVVARNEWQTHALENRPTNAEEATGRYYAIGCVLQRRWFELQTAQGEVVEDAKRFFPNDKGWRSWVRSHKTCPMSSAAMNLALYAAGYDPDCGPQNVITRFDRWFNELCRKDDPRVAGLITAVERLMTEDTSPLRDRDGGDEEVDGATTTPLNERRLAKMLALLSSPVDTEVVAAARALERALKRSGTDYVELAQKLVVPTSEDPLDELRKGHPWTHGVETHADRADRERKRMEQRVAELEELIEAELDPAVRARREEQRRADSERRKAEHRERQREERRQKKAEKQKRAEAQAAREAKYREEEAAYQNSPEAQALRPLREKEAALQRQFTELRTKRENAERAAASARAA